MTSRPAGTNQPETEVDVVYFDFGSKSSPPGPNRRQSIIDAAASLFDEAGYHRTSLTDVARAVGIAKPTLYHYFTSKEEILFWIHDEFINLLIERQAGRDGTGLSPSDALRAIIGDQLDLMVTHRGHIRVFYENYRELSSRWQAPIRVKRDQYLTVIVDVISQGIAEGSFKPQPPHLMALAVLGMCNWAYNWFSPAGPATAEEVAAAYTELVLQGLARN